MMLHAGGARAAVLPAVIQKQHSMTVLVSSGLDPRAIDFSPIEVGSAEPSQMNSPLTSHDSPLGSHTEVAGSAPILAVPI